MDDDLPRKESRLEAAKGRRRIYINKAACDKCNGRLRYTSSGQCVPCTKRRAEKNLRRLRSLLRGEE